MTVISDDLDELEDSVNLTVEQPKRKRSWLRWTPLALLVILLGLLIANFFVPLPVLSGKAGSELSKQTQAREEICAFAPKLATYDYRNIQPYFDGVGSRATGVFKDQFVKGQSELSDWLRQGQVVSKASGTSCGVEAKGDDLQIIIGITQNIASIATQGSGVDTTLSIVATVEKVGGKWMISKMDGPLVAK